MLKLIYWNICCKISIWINILAMTKVLSNMNTLRIDMYNRQSHLRNIKWLCIFVDVHGWPQPACDFPTWLTSHATWRDLESRHVYEITNDERGTITITYRRRPDSRGHVKFELRCSEILERHTTKNQIKVLSFTSHNWYVQLYGISLWLVE